MQIKAILSAAMTRFATLVIIAAVVSATAEDVSPLQKVVELLNNMAKHGTDEMNAEQIQYAKFNSFCKLKIEQNSDQVLNEEEKLGGLDARIRNEKAQDVAFDKRFASDGDLISYYQSELANTIDVRGSEKKQFEEAQITFEESQKRVSDAMKIVKKNIDDFEDDQEAKKKAKEALIQVQSAAHIKPAAKKAISLLVTDEIDTNDAALSPGDDPMDQDFVNAAPEARAYESHSGAIMEVLEQIEKDLEREAKELAEQEAKKQMAFETMVSDLKHQIALLQRDEVVVREKDDKVIRVQKVDVADWEDTTFMHTADYKDLNALIANCEEKARVYKERQTLRKEEIEAIEKATEVLSDGTIESNADKHLNWSLIQSKKGSVLSQLRATSFSPGQKIVVQYLQQEAGRLDSNVLSALAIRLAEDPYAKVKKMIKDLTTRLEDEATEEEEARAWCQRELESNKAIRDRKTDSLETMHNEIDGLQAEMDQIAIDHNQMVSDVAEIESSLGEATQNRNDEHKENTQSIEEAKASQAAVQRALVVLKEFYKKAGKATENGVSMVQRSKGPTVYHGMQDQSLGVINLLATIETDFARVQAEVESNEAKAEEEHQEFVVSQKQARVVKTKRGEHKAAQLKDREKNKKLLEGYAAGTSKELEEAKAYFDTLKGKCLDSGLSYEARVKARKEEIESLERALKVFSGEEIA